MKSFLEKTVVCFIIINKLKYALKIQSQGLTGTVYVVSAQYSEKVWASATKTIKLNQCLGRLDIHVLVTQEEEALPTQKLIGGSREDELSWPTRCNGTNPNNRQWVLLFSTTKWHFSPPSSPTWKKKYQKPRYVKETKVHVVRIQI